MADCRRKREGYSPARVVLEKREDESKNKLVECQRKREKESENNTEIANNELLRRPLELGVSKDENERDKTAKNETKEDNFEKVDRIEDNETEAERTPEESKSVFPRLRTCTGVGDQTTTKGELSSEMSRSQTREEKNNETLAEKVSKLENEGEEMNDIVKEVEKAEKLMAIIRDLENRDLNDQDRLTLKFVQEKLIERANQIKDLVKKKEEIVKNETAENELKVEVSDKVESDENEQEAKQVKDFIKKREDVVENETKEKEEEEAESDKVDDKESDLETNQEESRSVSEGKNKEEAVDEREDEEVQDKNEDDKEKETSQEESGDISENKDKVKDNEIDTVGVFLMTKGRSECLEIVESRKDVRENEENDKEKVKGKDDKEEVKNENEDDKERVKVKDEKDKKEVNNEDEDKKEKVLDDKAEVKYAKEDVNFSPPAKKIRKAKFSLLYTRALTRGGLGPLIYTSLAFCMAKTLWLSDEGTLPSPSATRHPPTGQTYTPATDTTAGSRYDVSAKSCDLGAIGRCPVTASISGQLCQMFFITKEYMGIFSPGLFKFFWSMPACATGEPPPRITLPGLTKLVKSFRSPPACSTGRPPPRTIMPPPITARGMG